MGATQNRREGSGLGITGVETSFEDIGCYVFVPIKGAFWGFQHAVGTMCTSDENGYDPSAQESRCKTSYTVQSRINQDKQVVYQENQTFARKQAA